MTPGTFPIEGDLAESWTQPNKTTYVFKLSRACDGRTSRAERRELVAEDVKYSSSAYLGEKGNADEAHAGIGGQGRGADRYTVRVTLGALAWTSDMLSNPSALWIIARECVDSRAAT